ncbi:MAG: DUF342 domain-containing protein [Calditrichaeota bacterium]|nr:DUF342 domain-containing protein [Calditrichota bacterium]
MKSIKLNISPDKYSASITIIAEQKEFPTEKEIYNAISSNNIIYGLDHPVISRISQNKTSVKFATIARGDQPKGRLNWHIEIDNPHKPTITKTNRADFKKLTSYHFISKNTKIVSLLDSTESKNGKKVTGEIVEPEMDELQFPNYENLTLSKDKKTLVANVSGYILWRDNSLVIEDVLHIKGNVDYSTGNLKLKGPVIIDGDVRSGFRVETDGSIFVGGSVDAANLFSQNGDITITHGILGQGRAKILCGGNLKCGFMQDANVAAQKDITLEKYALNSIVSSGGVIRTSENDSLIRGGILTAEKWIELHNVGSERGAETELKIRNYTEGESQSQLWQLNREKSSYTLRLSSLNKRKDFLLILKRGAGQLSDDKTSELSFIETEIARLKSKLGLLENDEVLLQKESSIQTIQKEIKIHGTMYKNVRIDIGGVFYKCDQPISEVRLVNFKEEIILESLKEPTSPDYDIFISEK